MAKNSAIEWTDHTYNTHWGCTRVVGSPACHAPCYAETFAKRTGHDVWGENKPRRFFGQKHLREPFALNAGAKTRGVRERVFVNSMSDTFEDRRDLDSIRDNLLDLITRCEWLDFLLLTKRPEVAYDVISRFVDARGSVLPNLWLGVTAETQAWFDKRVSILARTPAARRFVSYEPAVGALEVHAALAPSLHWIIVGGASGPQNKKLPLDIAWVESIATQTRATKTALFVKQDSGPYPGRQGRIPDDLWKIKEHPRTASTIGIDPIDAPRPLDESVVAPGGQLRVL